MSRSDSQASILALQGWLTRRAVVLLVICAISVALLVGGLFWLRPSGSTPTVAYQIMINPDMPLPGVGQLVFASPIKNHCRQMLFDNHTGATLQSGLVECDAKRVESHDDSPSNRLEKIRNSLKR